MLKIKTPNLEARLIIYPGVKPDSQRPITASNDGEAIPIEFIQDMAGPAVDDINIAAGSRT